MDCLGRCVHHDHHLLMIPTPDLSHLQPSDYDLIYEPAEDTFLLLDALEQDAEDLKKLKPKVCLEIGSGSGCVSSFIGTILGSSNALLLCTDINPHAARCTLATGSQNKISLNPLIASLDTPLRSRLAHSVDLVVFNPPYVPTFDEEAAYAQAGAGIAGAWAGGSLGMNVTGPFLDSVEGLLSTTGRFYLVAVKENNIPGIISYMRDRHQLIGEVSLHRRAGREHLHIIRFMR